MSLSKTACRYRAMSLAALFLTLCCVSVAQALEVGQWRGINISPEVSDAGLTWIPAIGFNVVRLSMNRHR